MAGIVGAPEYGVKAKQHRGGAGATRSGVVDGQFHRMHRLVGGGGHAHVLGHPRQDARQIHRPVVAGGALGGGVLGYAVVGHLGEDQHGSARQVPLHEAEPAGGGGERPLTGEHAGTAGEAAVHVGHDRGLMLVGRPHAAHPVVHRPQPVEHLDGISTGHAEHVGNARFGQHLGDGDSSGGAVAHAALDGRLPVTNRRSSARR